MPLICDIKQSTATIDILEPGEGEDELKSVTLSSITLFSLQAINEKFTSKIQIYSTLGTPTSFGFSEEPRVFSYEAIAINSPTARDLSEFQSNVLPTAKIRISYENTSRSGYVLTTTTELSAGNLNTGVVRFSIMSIDYYL